MRRKIYDDLLKWKEEGTKPLIVLGARQVGKTYIIDEFCKQEYTNYKKVNLLSEPTIIDLYKSNQNSEEKYVQLKTLLQFDPEKEDSILFVDEAQESEEFISDLKFFNENYPNVKIIIAGSLLGIQLKRIRKPFPVGKVELLEMYPMNFEEFLMAIGRDDLIALIKEHFLDFTAMPEQIHNLLLDLYNKYLICGGMPESIQYYLNHNQDISEMDSSILGAIHTAYQNDMSRYVKSYEESMKIGKLYQSIPSQLENLSHKFQYSTIEKGARTINYERVLDWLITSGLVLISKAIKNPIKPIKGYIEEGVFKTYLSDVGLLLRMLNVMPSDILMNKLTIYKGIITENYVAQQFASIRIPLHYWRSTNTAEIDFLLENEDGVIPVEVKAAENKKSKSLKIFMDQYKPTYAYRISSLNFGYNPTTRIKSIPLYAVFCMK